MCSSVGQDQTYLIVQLDRRLVFRGRAGEFGQVGAVTERCGCYVVSDVLTVKDREDFMICHMIKY